MMRRPPRSTQGVSSAASDVYKRQVSELSLLVQLVVSIVLVAQGFQAKQDTVEFFAYLITALILPLGAVFWALLERSKWSTVVLGVAALSIAVMLVRMHQIWTGVYV